MVAAKKLYPEAKLVFSGNLNENVLEVYNLYKNYLNIYKGSEISIEKVKKVIIVDTDNINKIGKFKEAVLNSTIEVIIYDHHTESICDKKDNFIVYKGNYGSNTTFLIKEILIKHPDIIFTDYEVSLFMMGIYEDTGNLSYTNTTVADIKTAALLLEKGANLEMVNNFVSKSLGNRQRSVFLEYMQIGEILEFSVDRIFTGYIESNEFVDGLDVIANKIKDIQGVDGVFIIFGNSERNYIVGRGSSLNIRVNEILADFGGGGHFNAGAAVVKQISVKNLYEMVKLSIEKKVKAGKSALEIMQSPVKTVKAETEIKEAYKIMLRFGYNSLPVINGCGKLEGVISRREMDRAIMHGFTTAPVRAYMSRRIFTAEPVTPVEKVKEILMKNDTGCVPIIDKDDNIIGVITRSDVLRVLYEQRKKVDNKEILREENIKKILNKNFPAEIYFILENVRKISSKRKEKAYLVGGIVRDLLLGIKNLDIDIVIEGNGTEFAKELALLLKADKIVIHDKFHTSVIFLENGLKVDIATSRIEYYEYPTSMPTVESSSIKQDLFRRDFTINAMALEIDYSSFGKLIDIFNGYKDLSEKKIRILHNFSFTEDPTRIIRCIRFAVRYGFTIEEDTEKFIFDAVYNGFLNKMSLKRVKTELEILLQEKGAEKAVLLLFEYGIFKSINSKLELTDKIKTNISKIKNYDNLLEKLSIKKWLIYFLTIFDDLSTDEMISIFEELSFKKNFIEKYSNGKNKRAEILNSLKKVQKPSEIITSFSEISKEVIIMILITEENVDLEEKIQYFFETLSKIKPILEGKDILSVGIPSGKHCSDILKDIFFYQLDNNINSKNKLIDYLLTIKNKYITNY